MVTITDNLSTSLREFLILPGEVKYQSEKVDLSLKLGENIQLQYPYLTARMQSVVGPEMAITAGRLGILTCVPRSLRDEDKKAILNANNKARLQKGAIEFVDNPEYLRENATYHDAIVLASKIGHSVIPVMDRFSKLYGFYVHDPDNMPNVPEDTPIINIIKNSEQTEIPIFNYEHEDRVSDLIKDKDLRFVPLVDDQGILKKIAFKQKFNTNYIGIAIRAKEDQWKEDIEKWGDQVDTLMLDSSNVFFPDAFKILEAAKSEFPNIPFGIGNIVTEEAAERFIKSGANYLMAGMGVGSICQTGSKRGNGRGQGTTAHKLASVRDRLADEFGYVPLIIDGGIRNTKDMTVALAFGDGLMMGSYFNKFVEAAGRSLDADKNPTNIEDLVRFKETWGEGAPKAMQVGIEGMGYGAPYADMTDVSHVIQRYGHTTKKAATVEGIFDTTESKGRIKPGVEEDARYIRTTIANSGATNLEEFRKVAILERASQTTMEDMYPHIDK